MFTIFINNSPIYITDNLKHSSETNFFYFDKVEVFDLIKRLENGKIKNVYLYHTDAISLFEKFKNNFKVIEAAGGVVKNSKEEVLFIYRNGTWDLPKGKIEKDEEVIEAALREVEEETGVKNLKIIEPLENTYHIYTYNDKKIFKVTYWYRMSTDFTGKLHPQLEEGITKVEWLTKEQIKKAMENTYANIKQCLYKSGHI